MPCMGPIWEMMCWPWESRTGMGGGEEAGRVDVRGHKWPCPQLLARVPPFPFPVHGIHSTAFFHGILFAFAGRILAIEADI